MKKFSIAIDFSSIFFTPCHQVEHFFGGFILAPAGQRNASVNGNEFIIMPFTLKIRGKKNFQNKNYNIFTYRRKIFQKFYYFYLQKLFLPLWLRRVIIKLDRENISLGSHVRTIGLKFYFNIKKKKFQLKKEIRINFLFFLNVRKTYLSGAYKEKLTGTKGLQSW